MINNWPDPRLLKDVSQLPPLRYCIFDLEATLFWSDAFREATFLQAVNCISDFLGISLATARDSLQSRRLQLGKELGYTPALASTVCSFGVTLDQWADYQCAVSVEDTIDGDPWLHQPFSQICHDMDVIVYTNMASRLAANVLRHLGVDKDISAVLTPQILGHAKPSSESVAKIISNGLIEPLVTLSVGDRYHVDIQPITRAGGYGYLVDSRPSLCNLLNALLS